MLQHKYNKFIMSINSLNETKNKRHYEFLFDVFSCTDLLSISPFSDLLTFILMYYLRPINIDLLIHPLSIKYGNIHSYIEKDRNEGLFKMYVNSYKYENNIPKSTKTKYLSDIDEFIKQENPLLMYTTISGFKRHVYTHNLDLLANINISFKKDTYTLVINDIQHCAVLLSYNYDFDSEFLSVKSICYKVLVPNTIFYNEGKKSIIDEWEKRSITEIERKKMIDCYQESSYPEQEIMGDYTRRTVKLQDERGKNVLSFSCYKNTSNINFEHPFSPLIAFTIGVAITDQL